MRADTRSLIIYNGLLRYWRLSLDGLKRQVLLPNRHTTFDIALFTSARVICTDRDRFYGDCPCFGSVPRNLTQYLDAALAPHARLVHTYFSAAYYSFHEGGIGAKFPTRLLWGVQELGRETFAPYAHILVLRPDVVLTAPLHVQRVCQANGGLNIVGGVVPRGFGFYNRDWDFAVLSCEPSQETELSAIDTLMTWYTPWQNKSALLCDADDSPPPLPAGFDGMWTPSIVHSQARYECAGMQALRSRGVPIGNLDAQGVFSRLMVNRTAPENWDWLHTKAGFGKTRSDGCVVGVNYTDPAAPLLTNPPPWDAAWTSARKTG